MILQLEFLRRLARRFINRDVKYPAQPQPLYDVEGLVLTQEDIAREYSQAIFERYGPLPWYEGQPYKNVIREVQWAGEDPTKIVVKKEYFLTGHLTIVGPDGLVYQVVGSQKSGQKYDPKFFDRVAKSAIQDYFPNKQAAYDYMEGAVIESKWYLTRFLPRSPQP